MEMVTREGRWMQRTPPGWASGKEWAATQRVHGESMDGRRLVLRLRRWRAPSMAARPCLISMIS